VIFPPPLHRGDPVAVVAPSGPFDQTAALAGIAWLEERYRVEYRRSIFARQGFLAGSDARRIAELQHAFDSDVRAVIAARGGYGLSRIAHLLDWRNARKNPRWIVGFSDLTVLHVESWRRGIGSVHGPMVCSLGGATERERAQWIATLENPREERRWEGLATWRRGRADGPLVGGNLAILHACAAASRLFFPKGAVILLEDVGERPYRVDRMLTNLITGGHFTRAAAIVVGSFTDCAVSADGTSVEEVLKTRLRSLDVPVVAGLPVGHGARNDALVLGRRAEVRADRGTLRLYQ
jgi:muramoyltetrapeptide carboxypeptidase